MDGSSDIPDVENEEERAAWRNGERSGARYANAVWQERWTNTIRKQRITTFILIVVAALLGYTFGEGAVEEGMLTLKGAVEHLAVLTC